MDYETKRNEFSTALSRTMAEIVSVRAELKEKSAKSRALIKEVYAAQTSVKIATAEAFSMIEGDGKNSYAQLGDKVFSCSNEQLRSAFVTTYAEPHIKALAKAESEKSANDSEIFALKDELNALIAMLKANTAEIESFSKNADLIAINRKIESDKLEYDAKVKLVELEVLKRKEQLDLELTVCNEKSKLTVKEFEYGKELLGIELKTKKEIADIQLSVAQKIADLSVKAAGTIDGN